MSSATKCCVSANILTANILTANILIANILIANIRTTIESNSCPTAQPETAIRLNA